MKVTASAAFDQQRYGLQVKTEALVGGFRDIEGHWAEAAVSALSKQRIVGGSGDYRFNPNERITRAEAVSMLVRAIKPLGGTSPASFRDVPVKHWAYAAIREAASAGWIGGYPDGSFGPEQSVTREEMAVLLQKAKKVTVSRPSTAPYNDVSADRWSSPAIWTMKQNRLMGGYPGNRFAPDQSATRAEFAAVLWRMLSNPKL